MVTVTQSQLSDSESIMDCITIPREAVISLKRVTGGVK